MDSNSTPIISAQEGPHKDLHKILQRHQQAEFKNIIPDFALSAFTKVDAIVQAGDQAIILDSGCGTGESSYQLAKQFPNHWVIAIDKSQHRLDRSHAHGAQPHNLMFVRCDLIHFWGLVAKAQWPIDRHYLLYPNPWPKPSHLQRRWHGHPIFPTLTTLSKNIILRTNWQIYAQEFALALEILMEQPVDVASLTISEPMTAFERKYNRSGHSLYAVEKRLSV